MPRAPTARVRLVVVGLVPGLDVVGHGGAGRPSDELGALGDGGRAVRLVRIDDARELRAVNVELPDGVDPQLNLDLVVVPDVDRPPGHEVEPVALVDHRGALPVVLGRLLGGAVVDVLAAADENGEDRPAGRRVVVELVPRLDGEGRRLARDAVLQAAPEGHAAVVGRVVRVDKCRDRGVLEEVSVVAQRDVVGAGDGGGVQGLVHPVTIVADGVDVAVGAGRGLGRGVKAGRNVRELGSRSPVVKHDRGGAGEGHLENVAALLPLVPVTVVGLDLEGLQLAGRREGARPERAHTTRGD